MLFDLVISLPSAANGFQGPAELWRKRQLAFSAMSWKEPLDDLLSAATPGRSALPLPGRQKGKSPHFVSSLRADRLSSVLALAGEPSDHTQSEGVQGGDWEAGDLGPHSGPATYFLHDLEQTPGPQMLHWIQRVYLPPASWDSLRPALLTGMDVRSESGTVLCVL